MHHGSLFYVDLRSSGISYICDVFFQRILTNEKLRYLNLAFNNITSLTPSLLMKRGRGPNWQTVIGKLLTLTNSNIMHCFIDTFSDP